MRRFRHLLRLLATLAFLLTACRSRDTAAPAPTATTPPTIVTSWSAVGSPAPPTRTLLSATTTTAATTTSEQAGLAARPLHLPALALGTPCPVTPWQPAAKLDVTDFQPTWSYFAFGPGPIYPIIYGFDPTSRTVQPSQEAVSGWTVAKVLWLIAPSYRAPALVRARRLDAASPVPFFQGRAGSLNEVAALQLPAAGTSAGWQTSSSGIHFPAPVPGCYAFQVDGLSFTDVVIFASS